jgi:hypothetical protein
LLKRVGHISQLGGVRLCQLLDGRDRGLRVADFQTGGGLHFSVLLDRGMDIGPADYAGRPLAWLSPTGPAHPAYFEAQGWGFLRTFHGGLLTGGGLTYVGHPSVDGEEELGLHGRLSHIPASNVNYGGRWESDEYVIWVEGQMRETAVFGPNLVLNRRISTWLGGRQLVIEDLVTNEGWESTPNEMLTNEGWESTPNEMLYHCNFGFPVVSADTELLFQTKETSSRDISRGTEDFDRFQDPTAGYAEHVLDHIPRPDETGYARAALVNRALDFGAYIKFRVAELPRLLQWKMMGEGTYVVGLEPTNCGVEGRAKDRERGLLRTLEPGEQVAYRLEIGVLPDTVAIQDFEKEHF